MNEVDENKRLDFARRFLKLHKAPLLWGEWSSYQVRSSYKGFFTFKKYDALFYSPEGNVFMVYYRENRFRTLEVYVKEDGDVRKISPVKFFLGIDEEEKGKDRMMIAEKYFESHISPLLWGKWTSYHMLHVSYEGFFVLGKYETLFYTPRGNCMIIYHGDNRFWIQEVYVKENEVKKISPMEFFLQSKEEVITDE